jgi:hypothetical protein
MSDRKFDWIGIEGAYCAGEEPLRAIGRRFGISIGMISKAAKQRRWVRQEIVSRHRTVNSEREQGERAGEQERSRVALADIEYVERGVRIHGQCLVKLEEAVRTSKDPRELRVIAQSPGPSLRIALVLN